MHNQARPSPERPVHRTLRIPLPVLDTAKRTRPHSVPRSSIARWRVGVLIAVHLAMIAHILHWWITGRSVGRFVLSDSMRTLEIGEINPGFLLFTGSLAVTALFGRLMCGWICHMGALQDLAAWLLRRVGVRPRLFRSRLLGFVPLALACYMFLWPTFRRLAVDPALARLWPDAFAARGQALYGFHTAMISADLWEGLPSWKMAIPFLLLCGFAMVYFLGARGLCRYGCPYGGFLLPAEQLAPMRVVADMSRCDQCGICTAACTTGVRVHDEIRLHGLVVNRNCVRSLDCVSSCPSGALSFSLTRPAAFRTRADVPTHGARYDLTFGEELLCLGIFAAVFFVARGLYELVPMLLAATLGVLAAFLGWKACRLLRDENVRLGPAQLRLHGVVRPAGWAFAGAMLTLTGLWIHAAVIRAAIWRASIHDDRVLVSFDAAIGGGFVPAEDRAQAQAARQWYSLARPISHGGWALASTPSAEMRLAWMELVLGEMPAATMVLQNLIDDGRAPPVAGPELARLLATQGRMNEAIAVLERIVRDRPRWSLPRDALAMALTSVRREREAEQLYLSVLADRPSDLDARLGLGRWLMQVGRPSDAARELTRACNDWPGSAPAHRDLAVALFGRGQTDEAIAHLRAGAAAQPAFEPMFRQIEEQMLRSQGR